MVKSNIFQTQIISKSLALQGFLKLFGFDYNALRNTKSACKTLIKERLCNSGMCWQEKEVERIGKEWEA